MSNYFGYVDTVSSACTSDSASHAYSADFYVENNMTHPSILESALWEPIPLDEIDVHCVLTSGLTDLLPRFNGFAGECPHRHLEEFYTICSSKKPLDVPDDHMFLKAFPHSLEDAAMEWLIHLPPEFRTNWEDLKHLFLDRF